MTHTRHMKKHSKKFKKLKIIEPLTHLTVHLQNYSRHSVERDEWKEGVIVPFHEMDTESKVLTTAPQ